MVKCGPNVKADLKTDIFQVLKQPLTILPCLLEETISARKWPYIDFESFGPGTTMKATLT